MDYIGNIIKIVLRIIKQRLYRFFNSLEQLQMSMYYVTRNSDEIKFIPRKRARYYFHEKRKNKRDIIVGLIARSTKAD